MHVYGLPFKNTPINSLTSFYKMPNTMWALQFSGCRSNFFSTFSLMSLTNVLGNGKVFIVGNSAIPTIRFTLITQAVIFAVAILLTYVFYNRKEIIA